MRASLFSVGRLTQSSAPDLAGAEAYSPAGADEGELEWLAQAKEQIEPTIKLVAKVMVDAPMPALQLSVPLQVDARAAHNWDEAH